MGSPASTNSLSHYMLNMSDAVCNSFLSERHHMRGSYEVMNEIA